MSHRKDFNACAFADDDSNAIQQLCSQDVGRVGELLAAAYLQDRGYEIIERGYRCREGEADIVALDSGTGEIALIEVKTRRAPKRSGVFPEDAVDVRKRRRYARIAACYIMDRFPIEALRFDVIAIVLAEGGVASVRHYLSAFAWDGETL